MDGANEYKMLITEPKGKRAVKETRLRDQDDIETNQTLLTDDRDQ